MTYFLLTGWVVVAATLIGMFRLRRPSQGPAFFDCLLRALGVMGGASLVPALIAWAVGTGVHQDQAFWTAAMLPFFWFAALGGGTAVLATAITGLDYAHDKGGNVWVVFMTIQAIAVAWMLASSFARVPSESRGLPARATGVAMAICGNSVLGLLFLMPMITND